MKFALLGCDDDAFELAREVASQRPHQIVAVFEAESWRTQLQAVAPLATWSDQWESLLLGNLADAVIVAGDAANSDLRADQLRKLVQAAVPLVLVHPACEAIIALELDMIRRDTRCLMISHAPGRLHPLFLQLQELVHAPDGTAFGTLEQIVFERSLEARDRKHVIQQFARDAELLRTLLGNINKVNASGAANDANITSLSIHVANPASLPAHWNLEPRASTFAGKLNVFGSQGKVTLHMPADPTLWKLEANDRETASAAAVMDDWTDAKATLLQLEAATQNRTASPEWAEVCRTLEVVDATERSFARGRAIELQQTVVSEQDTFKGMMAAGGCFLLLIVLMVLFFSSIFEGIRLASHPGRVPTAAPAAAVKNGENPSKVTPNLAKENGTKDSPLKYWPVCLATPLVIFLLLQFLQLVFQPPKKSTTGEVEVGE